MHDNNEGQPQADASTGTLWEQTRVGDVSSSGPAYCVQGQTASQYKGSMYSGI